MNDKRLLGLSRSLRKNMTKEERHLWYDFLKELPLMVHRQKVIGSYIVDFYIAEKNIVIELDGSQHYSEKGKAYDLERDVFLASKGITVLRYANSDVNERFESVCEDIYHQIMQ